jgi:hypothetical protein
MKKLEMWRNKQKLMIMELAEKSGLSPDRIAQLEDTKSPVTGIEALCLGWGLGMDPEELTGFKQGFGFSAQRPSYSFDSSNHQNFGGYIGIRIFGREDHHWLPVTHGVARRIFDGFDSQEEGFTVFSTLTNKWIALRAHAIADIRYVDADRIDVEDVGENHDIIQNQLRMSPSHFHALREFDDGYGHDTPEYNRLIEMIKTRCAAYGVTEVSEEVYVYDAQGVAFSFTVDLDNMRQCALAICAAREVIPFTNFETLVDRRFRTNHLAMVSLPLHVLKRAVDRENTLYEVA